MRVKIGDGAVFVCLDHGVPTYLMDWFDHHPDTENSDISILIWM